MRKFRYGDPTKSTWRRLAPWAYFIIGWNIFGIVLYKSFDTKKKKEDPDWDTKTDTQKYMNFATIGNPSKQVVNIKIEGVQDIQTSSGDLKDFKKNEPS